eukprot:scaffold59117_cov28-Tisochrysis_lutea.AAC.2
MSWNCGQLRHRAVEIDFGAVHRGVQAELGLEAHWLVRENGQHVARVLVRAADVRHHHPRVLRRSLVYAAAHHDLTRFGNVDKAVGTWRELHYALGIGASRLVAR